MRDILIIFCVLLVVMLLISTLGGSIRPAPEPEVKIEHYKSMARSQQKPKSHFTEQPTVMEESPEMFQDGAPDGFDGGDDPYASF